MESKSRDGSFGQTPHQSVQDSNFSSADELISFAGGYFASDFPNSESVNCPVKGTLFGLVRSGKPPDNQIRSHMFGCSECFSEYQNELAAYGSETKSVAAAAYRGSWWTKVAAARPLRPVPVLACALLLILLGFVGLVFIGSYVTRGNRNAAFSPGGNPPSLMRTADGSTPPSSPKQDNQQKTPEAPSRVASAEPELVAMSIDLGNYAITRGGAASSVEIKFPQRRTRLMLKLPEGSAKGFYFISVVSAAGKALDTTRARSRDGKTLAAILNLQGLAPEKYRLQITREGEPPVEVPIRVLPNKNP